MSAVFGYPLREKVCFYLGYFIRKVFCLWFEVKRPKLRVFIYEMVYSAKKLFDYTSTYVSPFDTETVETVFGKFRIRPGTADMSSVSPAFERRDLERLLGLIDGLLKEGKRVLFLDIGADLAPLPLRWAIVLGTTPAFASWRLSLPPRTSSSFRKT